MGLARHVQHYLRGAQAPLLLSRYSAALPGTSPSGRHFEALGGGRGSSSSANLVTAEDLVAVEMFSVQLPAEFSFELLEGERLGRRPSEQLSHVPSSVRLGDEGAGSLVAEESPALAWRPVVDQHGVGFVTAGRPLARKRPHLIPVYDDVVRCALGTPKGWVDIAA